MYILPSTDQPCLLSFTLDNSTALGGSVTVDLFNRAAILVGRNGAGKSAILEGFESISLRAIGRRDRGRLVDSDSMPRILDIEISTPTERRLRYRYELIVGSITPDDQDVDDSTNEGSEEGQFSWNELCQYIDGEQEIQWTTESGVTFLYNNNEKRDAVILGDTNSLRRGQLAENSQLNFPEEMQWIHSVLKGVRLLGKTPVRQTVRRRPSLLWVSSKGIQGFGLADSLARKIFRRVAIGELDELESVCQRIGLGSKITVQKFVPSNELRENEDEYASVLLDGVNIGLLSDGTLRVLSILLELITLPLNATTIIEEPEAQIHPGMLAKLLNEIEAYTFEGNLILSTHSPQVVAWTKPDKINIVYRDCGQTNIRKLHEQEIQTVVEYLYEEGDLGEWLYSGVLDE
jgi:predicted ATPase